MPKLSELPAASAGQTEKLVAVQGSSSYIDVQIPLDASLSMATGSLAVDAGHIGIGTLAAAHGGTGLNGTSAAPGELLIGNGTGFALGTITAGTNISITNGAGSITIAASGSSSGIKSIVAATPLTGGTITTSGTIGFEAIASGDVIANTAGTSAVPAPVSLSALLDAVIGSTEGDLLVRGASGWTTITAGTSADVLTSQGAGAVPIWAPSGAGSGEWTAGTVSTLGADFSLSAGTLALADSLVNIGTNDYVFSNGATIEGVSAVGCVDLIFQGGATVATGEYVLETALPYPITIADAKTWISGTSPSATGVAVQVIHAGTTTAVTGLSALAITAGTPNSPTTTSATGANTAAAGDTLQVNIGTVSGAITALGIHLDFTRTG